MSFLSFPPARRCSARLEGSRYQPSRLAAACYKLQQLWTLARSSLASRPASGKGPAHGVKSKKDEKSIDAPYSHSSASSLLQRTCGWFSKYKARPTRNRHDRPNRSLRKQGMAATDECGGISETFSQCHTPPHARPVLWSVGGVLVKGLFCSQSNGCCRIRCAIQFYRKELVFSTYKRVPSTQFVLEPMPALDKSEFATTQHRAHQWGWVIKLSVEVTMELKRIHPTGCSPSRPRNSEGWLVLVRNGRRVHNSRHAVRRRF